MNSTYLVGAQWIGAAALVGTLVSACATTESAPIVGDPYATEAQWCEAFAAAVCNAAVVKGCYESSAESLADDTISCIDAASSKATCNGSGLPYKKAGAEACLKALRDMYADAKLTTAELDAASGACLGAFSKDGQTGETCSVDTDCDGAQALRCIEVAESSTCQVPEVATGGASCAAANVTCEKDFFCHSDANACVENAKEDEDCSAKPCIAETTCDANTMKCQAKLGNGTDCSSNDECKFGFCVQPAAKCGAQLSLTISSDACKPFQP